MSIANINTHKVSANNGQGQIRMAYNDFLYDDNKGKQKHNANQKPHNFSNMKVMKQMAQPIEIVL